MEINQDQIDALIRNPSESLNVEIKRWIDPTTPEGQAKIIGGCLALRNRNGGYFVVGFDDNTLQPDQGNVPPDPRIDFHVDIVQGLISKYAYDLFEVGVAFSRRDNVEYPVIVVPTGVQVPVAAKKNLVDASNRNLIRQGGLYFRTLNANGVPSTSLARPQDWRDIVEICFENREADIGRFLRRHLSGLDPSALVDALQHLGLSTTPPVPPLPSLRDEAASLLHLGEERFQNAVQTRSLDDVDRAMVEGLAWHVALVVKPGWSDGVADADFLADFLGSNPRYTGWPIWLDSRSHAREDGRPFRVEGAWEALVVSTDFHHLDFMRFDPTGRFYLRRALQDDLTDKVEAGTALDPILVILRVAEAIAVGIAAVRNLEGAETAPRHLGFAFRWTKLADRVLTPWANPMIMMIGERHSREDEVTTFVELTSDTPSTSIAPFVDEATRELFALFDGERIPYNVVEDWTSRLVERRLR